MSGDGDSRQPRKPSAEGDAGTPPARRFLSGLSTRRFLGIFLALYAVALAPVLCLGVPSVSDYPNHLARVHVLLHPEAFGDWYVVRWTALPNLAFDGIVGALATVMPPESAGKVFLALTLLLLALGTVLLHRHLFGEWALWPCVSFAFLYSRILLSGVVGYLFGVGLCLLATTAWLRARSRPPWQRLLLGIALSMALFFAHFMAFAIYGLVVFSAEVAHAAATRPADRRRSLAGLAVTALQGIPPLLVLAFLTPKAPNSARIVFRSLQSRIEAVATPFYVYDPALDFALVALLLVAIVHGLWARRLSAPREIVCAIVALSALHLAMPNVVMTLEGADRRLPIVAALLFFGGTRLDVRRSRASKAILAALVLVFLGRMAGVFGHWRSDQAAYEDAQAAMGPVAPGSSVVMAYPKGSLDTVAKRSFAVYHVPVWETVRRGGFSPGLFAFAPQQPVRMTPDARALADALSPPRLWGACAGAAEDALTAEEAQALARYDYVVFVDGEPFTLKRTLGLVPVADTPCAKLYRVPR